MTGLVEHTHRNVRNVDARVCYTKAGLAINAAGAATIKTAVTKTYAVDGLLYTKAALAAQSLVPTHGYTGESVSSGGLSGYPQPAGQTVIYVVALDAAGGVAIVQGSYSDQRVAYANDLSRIPTAKGGNPLVPSGFTPIGAIKIVNNSANPFTPGVTALDAAGIAATFYDVSVLPENLV